jgi:hypothetical protein
MLGVSYFMVFILLGIMISNRIFREQPLYIKGWTGTVIGLLGSMWLVVPFSFILGFNIASHVLALSLMAGAYLFVNHFNKNGNWTESLKDGNEKVLCLTVLPIFLVTSYLFYTHILLPGNNGGLFGGQSTFGDLSLHLGIVTSIAEQGTFPPEYSIFPGKMLSYPFLINSLSSSLYLFGTSLRWAVLVPSFVMSLALITGFFIVANEILKNKYAAAFAVVLFFFNGGFGFIYFMDGIAKKPENFTRMFTAWYNTPTNYNEHLIRWSNTICDMIIPQRTTMAGWTIVLFAFWLLQKALSEKRRTYFVYSGIVAGLLPMIHTHSFLAFGIISAVWSVTCLIQEDYKNVRASNTLKVSSLVLFSVIIILPKAGWMALAAVAIIMIFLAVNFICQSNKRQISSYISLWISFLIPVIFLALPQLLFWTFPQSSEGSFLKLQWGWAANGGDLWPWFWIKNVGVVMLLIIPAILAADRKIGDMILGPSVLFAVSNLILFQPNNYDNNKLLYVWYMFAVIIVSGYVFNIYERIREVNGTWCLLIIITILSTLSGLLTIGREINSAGIQNYSSAQVEAADFIKKRTAADALFLTGDQHLNPVSALAGRKIYSGAPLYLYFHGVNYSTRAEQVKRMYQSPEELKELAAQLDICYVLISNYEKSKYSADVEFFKNNFPILFHKEDIYIFDVR